MKRHYSTLTKDDIIEAFKLLSKPQPQREYVILTGLSGMYMFDFAMRGIDLPKDVSYSWIIPKRMRNTLYITIGVKHSNYKISVDMSNKKYTSLIGTKKIGTYDDINKAVKSLNLN